MISIDKFKTAAEIQADLVSAARARRIAMNITQKDLSARSGVAIATLRRFEAGESTSLATVLAIAEALDALDGFTALFPLPEMASLDDLEAAERSRVRASKKRQSL